MKRLTFALSFISICIFHLLCGAQLHAQDIKYYTTESTDITARTGFDLTWKFRPDWSLKLEDSFRLKDNLGSFDRNYTTLSLHWKSCDYFKIGAGYRFMTIRHDGKKSTDYEKYWDLRHRAYVDLTGMVKVDRFKISLRERTMATFRTYAFDEDEKVNPAFMLRSKLMVEYSFFNKPLRPYVSFELSNTLNVPEYVGKNYIDEYRYSIGLKWRMSRKLALDAFYRFDDMCNYDVNIHKSTVDLTTEKGVRHIFGVILDIDL